MRAPKAYRGVEIKKSVPRPKSRQKARFDLKMNLGRPVRRKGEGQLEGMTTQSWGDGKGGFRGNGLASNREGEKKAI